MMASRIAIIALAGPVIVFTLSIGSANAKSDASCTATTPSVITHKGENGTECQAQVIGGGRNKATSHASGSALAGSVAKSGGTADAKASNGGQATSEACAGKTTATANGSNAKAVAKVTAGGSAEASAKKGAQAVAMAAVQCKVRASAADLGSFGQASCSNLGSVITVEATKGSTAEGSDTKPPSCKRVNGGIAKVRSPGGNCG
jgi:hypothetical protein